MKSLRRNRCCFAAVTIAFLTLSHFLSVSENWYLSQGTQSFDKCKSETNARALSGELPTGIFKPWHILQYGMPRTATTFQYQTLCASMFVMLYDEAKRTGNSTNVEKFECAFNGTFTPDAPMVAKTHQKGLQKSYRPEDEAHKNMLVFATAKGDPEQVLQKLSSEGYNVKYVQDTYMLGRLGHNAVFEYQQIFNMRDEQMSAVQEYMRYWNILRICCGTQMSSDWRYELLPPRFKNKKKFRNYTLHHDAHSPTFPACQMYDIDQVEKQFLQTRIVQVMQFFPKMREGRKPAGTDGELDGTYCSRYNQAVREKGLQFNQRIDFIPRRQKVKA